MSEFHVLAIWCIVLLSMVLILGYNLLIIKERKKMRLKIYTDANGDVVVDGSEMPAMNYKWLPHNTLITGNDLTIDVEIKTNIMIKNWVFTVK